MVINCETPQYYTVKVNSDGAVPLFGPLLNGKTILPISSAAVIVRQTALNADTIARYNSNEVYYIYLLYLCRNNHIIVLMKD